MRTLNPQPVAILPLRVVAVVAVWAPCAVLLGLGLGSPLAVAVLTVAVLSVSHVYARFEAQSVAEAVWKHATALDLDDTGLASTSQADHFLASEFAAARRGRKVTLVIFGLDGIGSPSGEAALAGEADVLREFGKLLSGMTRRMNLTARYGWRSDAFLSVLSNADAEAAELFVKRVREMAASAGGALPDFSAGIVEYTPDILDPAQFVEAARQALQESRGSRKSVLAIPRGGPVPPGKKGYINVAF